MPLHEPGIDALGVVGRNLHLLAGLHVLDHGGRIDCPGSSSAGVQDMEEDDVLTLVGNGPQRVHDLLWVGVKVRDHRNQSPAAHQARQRLQRQL